MLRRVPAAGAQTNYPIEITVSDPMAAAYPYLAANPSFQVVSEDMFGGSNGQASQYGTIYSYEAGYAPNGNVVTYADSVMGTWNFSYDAADRLTGSQNTAVGSSNQFSGYYGCWSYDAYGNRLAEANSTTPCGNNPTKTSWANYNTANNRITSSSSAPGGVTYDAAGNLLLDGVNEYWYDAEGRLCAVNTPSQGLIQYIYDAEGARIGKQSLAGAPGTYATCAVPTLGSRLIARYLLGQGNEQVTEVNGSQQWVHSNLWIASRLSATYATDGLHYELADPLGTRRILADINGTVQQRCTSLPFGDVEDCPTTPTEHLFTQHERDTESGNDYFGARYYSSNFGRFMSPDWNASEDPVPYASLAVPQSLNLYTYVGNNPLTHADLDGHACQTTTGVTSFNGQVISQWTQKVCSGLDALEQNLYMMAANGAIRTANATAQAASDVDWFNKWLGFGNTNCSTGGDCGGAVGQAFGAVVAGVLSDGFSEEELLARLSTKEAKVEAILEHLTEGDLRAAQREVNGGMRIAKPGGGYYEHAPEVREAVRGLKRQLNQIKNMYEWRTDLSPATKARFDGAIRRIEVMIDAGTSALTRTPD